MYPSTLSIYTGLNQGMGFARLHPSAGQWTDLRFQEVKDLKDPSFSNWLSHRAGGGGSFFLGGRAPIWWFWWSKQGGNPCWKRAVVFIHLVDEWWYPLMRSWRFRVNSWYLTMYSHRKLARLVLFFPRSCVAGAALSQTTRTGSTDQWKKNLVGGTCPFLGRMIMMYGSPFEPSKIWIDGILPYSSYGNLLIN